jgi:hypothetical protein
VPTIAAVVSAFQEHVVGDGPGRLGNYLYIWRFDLPRIVDHLFSRGFAQDETIFAQPGTECVLRKFCPDFGLGMFSQDIAESMNRLLKDAFVSFTNRGGGDAGHAGALRQAWQRLFLDFHVPLLRTGQPKKAVCQNRDAFRGDGGESDDDA